MCALPPPRTHFAQYLRYVGQICHSLICFLFSITINVCFYKKFIITCFKKSLFEQKNDSNEYKYRSFYTNNHIFVLGKNRFISPYCSGSFCPKLRTGADNAAYWRGCFVQKILKFAQRGRCWKILTLNNLSYEKDIYCSDLFRLVYFLGNKSFGSTWLPNAYNSLWWRFYALCCCL